VQQDLPEVPAPRVQQVRPERRVKLANVGNAELLDAQVNSRLVYLAGGPYVAKGFWSVPGPDPPYDQGIQGN